jgi:hypothetical protein
MMSECPSITVFPSKYTYSSCASHAHETAVSLPVGYFYYYPAEQKLNNETKIGLGRTTTLSLLPNNSILYDKVERLESSRGFSKAS